MTTNVFPYIPPDLLRELNKRFPEKSAPSPEASIEELMWQGGAREVIRLLNHVAADQSRNQLTGEP